MQREKQVIDSFTDAASVILTRYIENISNITAAKGQRPSFEELMVSLKKMEKELTTKAVKLAEQYQKEWGEMPSGLSENLKEVTTNTIQQFVKTL